jgi:hypothetical protein
MTFCAGGKVYVQEWFIVQSLSQHRNHHVFHILPVTTLRTIDLECKKNYGPLFSRFWVEERVFFEGNSAP